MSEAGTGAGDGAASADAGAVAAAPTPGKAQDSRPGKEPGPNFNPGQPKPGAPARPEYIEEKHWDAEKGEVRLEALARSYKEAWAKASTRNDDLAKQLRQEIEAERFKERPESPDKYELKMPEGFEQPVEFGPEEKNPALKWWRETAHNLGLNQKQFSEGLKAYYENQIAQLPDLNAEKAKLGEKATDRIRTTTEWVKANLSEKAAKAIMAASTSAEVIIAVEEIMGKLSGSPIAPALTPKHNDVPLTKEILRSRMMDPRYYDPNKRDPAFVKEIEEGFRKLASQS